MELVIIYYYMKYHILKIILNHLLWYSINLFGIFIIHIGKYNYILIICDMEFYRANRYYFLMHIVLYFRILNNLKRIKFQKDYFQVFLYTNIYINYLIKLIFIVLYLIKIHPILYLYLCNDSYSFELYIVIFYYIYL